MRLDRRVVEEGFAPSRARARALIEAGAVMVAGKVVQRPSDTSVGQIVLSHDPCPWVSRAGLKLDHALRAFDLLPSGVALDLGASTGGFTDVLLGRGVSHVFAVDVGHGQLAPKLAQDPRVTNLERVNARALPADVIGLVDWITVDVSFISLEKVLPSAFGMAQPEATLVALVKPQFEAGPAHVGKGGIVRKPAVHVSVLIRIRRFLGDHGWAVVGETESPIEGSDGNREFLIAARAAGA